MNFFFGPKYPDFGPKIRFFVWDPVFWQRGARNPRRWFRFGTFGSIVRFFVSELRPFSWGEPGRRAKKSYPTPLWGHRLPVTALALSACRLHYITIIIYKAGQSRPPPSITTRRRAFLEVWALHSSCPDKRIWEKFIGLLWYSLNVVGCKQKHMFHMFSLKLFSLWPGDIYQHRLGNCSRCFPLGKFL